MNPTKGPSDIIARPESEALVRLSSRLAAAAPLGTPAEQFQALIQVDPEGAAQWLIESGSGVDELLGPRAVVIIGDLLAAITDARNGPAAARLLPLMSTKDWRIAPRLVADVVELAAPLTDRSRLAPLMERELTRSAGDPSLLRTAAELCMAGSLPGDAHDLLTRLALADPSPGTVRSVARWRHSLDAQVGTPVRAAFLSSFTTDLLAAHFDAECRALGIVPETYIAPFNAWGREARDPAAGVRAFDPEVTFLSVALEDLVQDGDVPTDPEAWRAAADEAVELVLSAARQLTSWSSGLLVVHGFHPVSADPAGIAAGRSAASRSGIVAELNAQLAAGLRELPRSYFLDIQDVLLRRAAGAHDDPKARLFAGMRLSGGAAVAVARKYAAYTAALKGLTRKCVVVDLDNTLWGGVVGEDGPDGIRLGTTSPGSEFREFQSCLRALVERGVLLAVNSKNNAEDALRVIREHPGMLLREDAFASLQINWRPKPENMRQIAHDLNIGLDSLVFLDDNPNERELMRRALPEVLTPELPRDPARYGSVVEQLPQLQALQVTEEDRSRTRLYREQRQRERVRPETNTLDSYLDSLNIVVTITRDDSGSLERVHQLLQRTNQFNLTTRRHALGDLTAWLRDEAWGLYTVRARDRFGDHGLSAAALVQRRNDGWVIESFVMSCRIISYGIESAILSVIVDDARRNSAVVIGEFIASAKNAPARDFYARHGFSRAGDRGPAEQWLLDGAARTVIAPAWITIEGTK